jgi:hypothetical protein
VLKFDDSEITLREQNPQVRVRKYLISNPVE